MVVVTGIGVGIHVVVAPCRAGAEHPRVDVVMIVGGPVVVVVLVVVEKLWVVLSPVLVKVGKVVHDSAMVDRISWTRDYLTVKESR